MMSPGLIPGLPRPLPDELLYSVIGRAARYLAYWSPKELNRVLYGKASVVACADLPGSLDLLEGLARGTWGMSVEEIAMRHTLVGYYTHHRGPQNQRDTIDAMRCRSAHLQVRLGICAGAERAPRRLRLCAHCVTEDMKSYGETYWRRSHHLPGTLVCSRHGVPLLETTAPFRPFTRHTHVSAHPAMLENASPIDVAPENLPMAQAIAVLSADFLDCPAPTLDWSLHWRSALTDLGYAGKRGSQRRLQEAFVDSFGEVFLSSLFRDTRSSVRWLEDVVRKPRRALHPLKHALLTIFVEQALHAQNGAASMAKPDVAGPIKTWGLYRSATLRAQAEGFARQGLSIRAIAREMHVDWKTAERMLLPVAAPLVVGVSSVENDRAAWLALSSASPEKTRQQLRQVATALYARLYRKDREWLMKNGPQPVVKKPMGPTRVAWSKRDAALAADIRARAAAMLQIQPSMRVSRHRITAELQCRSLVENYGDRLPVTVRTLDDVCESVEAFQVRRLAGVIRQDSLGESLPRSILCRRARINQTRFADRGEALIVRALVLAKASSQLGEGA